MFRSWLLLCAGLVAVTAGCAFNIGNTRVEAVVKIDEQAIDATMETAVQKVRDELEKRGIRVVVHADGDTTRVAATTKSGDRFLVVVSEYPKASSGTRTRLRVEWEKAPDRELWVALIATFGAAALQSGR